MPRFLATLCLAGALALPLTGCSSKPEQAAPPADTDAAAPGAEIRARADAGREKAAETRANADRMREAAGSGSASPATPAEPPVTATAAPAAAPQAAGAAPAPAGATPAPASAAQPTYGALPGGDVREGGATARSRADTLRSRADRTRSAAGTGEPTGATAAAPTTSATRPLPPTPAAAPAPAAAAPPEPAAPAPRSAAAPATAPGRPVDANELAALLPSMGAPWARSRVDANTLTSPVVFSQARVTYRQGSAYVRIEIVDSAGNQAALAQLTASLPAASKAGKDGYARRATLGGYPSWEAWRGSDQHGTLGVLVANRFLATYTGHGVESFQILADLAQRTDLRKLETLR
jgi:hypothetical protein